MCKVTITQGDAKYYGICIFGQNFGSSASAIREILKATADPAIIPFAAGNPDVAAFPVET